MNSRANWLNFISLLLVGCNAPLTHTALDLTPFGPLLYAVSSAVSIFYWVAAIAVMWFSVNRPATLSGKVGAVILVTILFGYLPVTDGWRVHKARVHQAKVAALFDDRCKTSGEKISRTVENVEGFMLLKLRPTNYSPYDQNAVDPYGYDFDWGYKDKPHPYIGTFLIGKDENGHFQESKPTVSPGYSFVEANDPNDGKRYRYTGRIEQPWLRDKRYGEWVREFVVDKTPAPGPALSYGITYDDITTREEREHWIAGSSLKVIDLKNNEVIAERIGYMVDFAQGATPSGRQPWTFAMTNKGWSCPALNMQSYGARRFVEKVLLIRNAQPSSQQDAAR